MNSLYTSGVRQTNSIQTDLERLRNGENSASLLGALAVLHIYASMLTAVASIISLLGQISASLAAMQRTIDDYDSMAKREIIKAKQEKAQMRVQKFRTDYNELRNQFDRLKLQAAEEKEAANRAELISSSAVPHSPSDSRRRFQNSQPPQQSTLHPGLRPQQSDQHSESPFRGSTPQGFSRREQYALDEHTFTQNTHERLDEFLAQGREVYENLVDQRNMLKGTQRRLLDTANTLGLSREVIGWIEKRSTQDTYIFLAGAIFTFVCFYLIWKYLG
ncbi:golgi SNAP receptor complex member bos1 [Mycena floridula]|nr:golgi SNAP receptor complex member bos1 [Mycena floridula]